VAAKHDPNFIGTIFETADRYPDRIAFRMPTDALSYMQFKQFVLSYALRMQELGVHRDSRICIAVPDPVSRITLALACGLLGCSWVQSTNAAIESEIAGITHLVQTIGHTPAARGKVLRVDQSWLPQRSLQLAGLEGFASPDAIWFVAQSSGTTGETKFMTISADAQFRRLEQPPFEYLDGAVPVTSSLMPHLMVYALEYILVPLMLGGTVVVSRNLKFLATAGVTTIVGSPAQYMDLCAKSSPLEKKIKCAVIGGAHSNENLFDQLLDRFELVQHQFGCSELGRISYNRFGRGSVARSSVGRAIPSARIQIVDAADREVPATKAGIVRIRSSAPMSGYIGEDLATTFRDGWFYSGDTGFLSEDGELNLAGRVNDVVNLGGVKLNAEAIDNVILAIDGVKDGTCFVQTGFSAIAELGVLIVPVPDVETKTVVEKVQASLLAKFGKPGLPDRIYVADAVPRNESGKISRQSLARLFATASPFASRMAGADDTRPTSSGLKGLKQDFNIANILIAAADRYSDRIAFKLTDGTLSHGQFRDMILSHASRMRARGVNRDSCVWIDVANPASQICIALACALLGCRWVRGSKEALANKAVGVTHLVHPGSKAPASSATSLVIDRSWLPVGPSGEQAKFEGFATPSSPWMIIQSSGTTGAPKFMAIPAGAMPTRVEARPYDYLGNGVPMMASMINHLFTFGLEYSLKALSLGGTVVVSRDFPFLMSAGVNTVVGSPIQVLVLCERSGPIHGTMKCAVLGGARCTEELLDRIFEKFELVQNQLGCSELGIMSLNRVSRDDANRLSVGHVVPSCTIEIVDELDGPVPSNTEGILRARTSTFVPAYLGGEAPEMVRDGWFYTGDTAILSDKGDLAVTGRINDVVNFGGAKLNAAMIDDVILATEGVKDGVCFAQSDFSPVNELGVLLVTEVEDGAETEATVSRVQANLLTKFGHKGLAQRIYVADSIPRNASGKISRHEIAQLLAKASPFAVRMVAS